MKPEKEYSKFGYHFSLVKCERMKDSKNGLKNYKAIYSADDGGLKNIEVVILKEDIYHPLSGKEGTKLHLPSSEKWGVLGFSFRDMESAERKYKSLCSN